MSDPLHSLPQEPQGPTREERMVAALVYIPLFWPFIARGLMSEPTEFVRVHTHQAVMISIWVLILMIFPFLPWLLGLIVGIAVAIYPAMQAFDAQTYWYPWLEELSQKIFH